MNKVFVYGSLKQGFGLHYVLNGMRFLGVGKTEPKFRLHSLGMFPAMTEAAKDGYPVLGEIYQVTKERLTYLDIVEGVEAGLYARRTLNVTDAHGEVHKAIVYVWPRPIRADWNVIKSGEWS